MMERINDKADGGYDDRNIHSHLVAGEEKSLPLTRDELVARLKRAGELEVSGEDQTETDSYFDTDRFHLHGPDGFEADYTGLTSYFKSIRAAFDDRSIRRGMPGSQYALYIHHSKPAIADPPSATAIWKYDADTSIFQDIVTLQLDAGVYVARWYNPRIGVWMGKPTKWKQRNGNHTFYTPPFITDIALSILRK